MKKTHRINQKPKQITIISIKRSTNNQINTFKLAKLNYVLTVSLNWLSDKHSLIYNCESLVVSQLATTNLCRFNLNIFFLLFKACNSNKARHI